MPEAFATRETSVDDRRVTYADVGTPHGCPVLLLHGGGFDHAGMTWRSTVEAMCDRHRFIVPDLPGYGGSASLAVRPTLSALGAWTVRFMDALGLDRVDLAGVSMGGGMALWCGITQGARVRRLVPVAAYGIMPRVPFHPLARLAARSGVARAVYGLAAASRTLARIGVQGSYADPSRVTDGVVRDVMDVAADQRGRLTFERFLEAELGADGTVTDLSERLHEIAVPTLLVHGAADRLVPVRHARAAAARIPDARLEVLPTGHWPMRERNDLFVPLFEGFLSRN